ncbi:hypothetical protein CEXT_471831 [Caerostris extrusa]|uniref:Uncharacterized protein n=1 Tax=Caerostris extrusa TaxID=172846 RepID=A0AAV4PSB1_CAEEX|nr:hypothetical protein CEXT_471831 [Caerostris extrusa]
MRRVLPHSVSSKRTTSGVLELFFYGLIGALERGLWSIPKKSISILCPSGAFFWRLSKLVEKRTTFFRIWEVYQRHSIASICRFQLGTSNLYADYNGGIGVLCACSNDFSRECWFVLCDNFRTFVLCSGVAEIV